MGKERKKDMQQEIRELSEKIEKLEQIIAHLTGPIGRMQELAERYIRMMDSLVRLGMLPHEDIFEGIKDDISREIIRALLRRNHLNISQITEAVREHRGTASRRIVRERLQELEGMGKVERRIEKKATVYSLSEEMVKKWSEVLGLFK
ncbi:MAG: hypothetical protein DRN21_01740 [Thermoplasmata archaeon]|nr:MAG: hypothetical protein DRN21_01740 [Thermoplasmata archaeon]HDN50924.1 hypothetical protein [Thermoplasmatales archaeon]